MMRPLIFLSVLFLSVVTGDKLLFVPSVTIVCPDKMGTCPDNTTCCLMTSGKYGCCPLPKAVCCSDHIHCCPTDYTCNLGMGTCDKAGAVSVPLLSKFPSDVVKSLRCADGRYCGTGESCCEKDNGEVGCCPLDSTTVTDSKMGSVICPDGQSMCKDGQTCCMLASGQYGCCPFPKAVCCSDHMHCCPHGSKCNLSQSSCDNSSHVISWQQPTPSMVIGQKPDKEVKDSNDKCDNNGSICPDHTICCDGGSGKYGCCPDGMPVCCSDGVHCCPTSFFCDVQGNMCSRSDVSLPWSTKLPTIPRPSHQEPVQSVGTTSSVCAEDMLSCKLDDGQELCCKHKDGVCCPGSIHCCPADSVCDPEQRMCRSKFSSLSISWTLMARNDVGHRSKSLQKNKEDTTCPDRSTCGTGQTCCMLPTGKYGCCPFDKAVCCSDRLHCCPHGTTCETTHSKCVSTDSGFELPWTLFSRNQARSSNKDTSNSVTTNDQTVTSVKMVKTEGIVCPDGGTCSDGQTCCMLPTGKYGCCPFDQAVCCSDRLHCCPHGTTCDTTQSKCLSTDSGFELPWNLLNNNIITTNEQTVTSVKVKNEGIVCPDGGTCADGQTCCMLPTGKYGCCPFDQAVCCSDRLHCCPHGFHCDTTQSKCLSDDDNAVELPWSLTAASRDETTVVCPDKGTCATGQTCCRMSTGRYGCCPFSQAVCCPDLHHCCPHGFHCDSTGSKCVTADGGFELPWNSFVRNQARRPADDKIDTTNSVTNDIFVDKVKAKVTCPDRSVCGTGQTCCLLATGKYGCCPFEQAVCCTDEVHCCPHGYHCDTAHGKCLSSDGGLDLPFSAKHQAADDDLQL